MFSPFMFAHSFFFGGVLLQIWNMNGANNLEDRINSHMNELTKVNHIFLKYNAFVSGCYLQLLFTDCMLL